MALNTAVRYIGIYFSIMLMPLVFRADGTPIEVSEAEYKKIIREEDEITSQGRSPEDFIRERAEIEQEKVSFTKDGWKEFDGLSPYDLGDSFRHTDWATYHPDEEQVIGLPDAAKLPYGTKYTIAWTGSGLRWYIEGQHKMPGEFDTPLTGYVVYEARDGSWNKVDGREII